MTGKRKPETSQKPIEQYDHKDKQRLNNPPVGLVDARTDNGGQKKKNTNTTLTLTRNCNGQARQSIPVLQYQP